MDTLSGFNLALTLLRHIGIGLKDADLGTPQRQLNASGESAKAGPDDNRTQVL